MVVAGAVPAVVLAIFIDHSFTLLERKLTPQNIKYLDTG